MSGTKADFRALREMVGASQQTLADVLGVGVRSIKRWEDPTNAWEPPTDAWDWLKAMLDRQRETVAFALRKAEETGVAHVSLTYWRDADAYEQAHPGERWAWQLANATARAVGLELQAHGYEVDYDFAKKGERDDWHGKLRGRIRGDGTSRR